QPARPPESLPALAARLPATRRRSFHSIPTRASFLERDLRRLLLCGLPEFPGRRLLQCQPELAGLPFRYQLPAATACPTLEPARQLLPIPHEVRFWRNRRS